MFPEFRHDDKICASLCRLGVVLLTVSIVCRYVLMKNTQYSHPVVIKLQILPLFDLIVAALLETTTAPGATPLIYSLINILIFSKFYII